jgi:prenyl protein peptidase
MYKRNGADRAAAIQAIAMSCKFTSSLDPFRELGGIDETVFQLTYTTLFGWFASYLFLRTGQL